MRRSVINRMGGLRPSAIQFVSLKIIPCDAIASSRIDLCNHP
ncbi:MAG: hypothetical protein VB140_03690 [Burkholderia sp.]